MRLVRVMNQIRRCRRRALAVALRGRRSLRTRPFARLLVGYGMVMVILTTLATCATWPRRVAAALGPSPAIRVLLAEGSAEVEIRIEGPFLVQDLDGNALASGRRLVPGELRANASGVISINGRSLGAESVTLRPEPGTDIQFAQRSYSGFFEINGASGSVTVLNSIALEDYLVGVLFSEMPRNFGREALRAQAVAARSYAVFKMQSGRTFLRPTEADQMYTGLPSPALTAEARAIVQSTHGEVLEFSGRPFSTYYSSTCGGTTGSAAEVFGERPLPCLGGVICRWCNDAPLYQWQRTLPKARFAEIFSLGGDPLLRVEQDFDRSGRAREVRLMGASRIRAFTGMQFRSLWNSQNPRDEQLPSFFLRTFAVTSAGLEVTGRGYGHGVGLCQYGCRGLAREGHDYRSILATYYPGAKLVRRW